jgi:uncharacterized protein with GYD domain
MSTYIQLLTLTHYGRERAIDNPTEVLLAQEQVNVPGVRVLGLYAVLGGYDFVSMVEAPDNDSIARYSLKLGVKAGVTVVTLPAIPVARLEGATVEPVPEMEPTGNSVPT